MQPTIFADKMETRDDQTTDLGEIRFTVYGRAQTAGSKKSFVPLNKKTNQPFRNKRGGVLVSTVDDNDKSRDWKCEVKDAARQAYSGERLDGPIEFTALFFVKRPKSHFRANGTLKPTAPEWCSNGRDVLKLARAVEDAITQATNIWGDDKQVSREVLEKRFADVERVEITVRPLTLSSIF